METMGNLRRTHYSDAVNESLVNETLTLAGSIAKSRDLGAMVFADLRDGHGLVQLAFGDGTAPDVFEKARKLKAEYVVMAKGTLRLRESANHDIPTGTVELFVTELRILSEAETPPFEVRDDVHVNEELRLRYRYLDLRRDGLHSIMRLRSEVCRCVRDYYYDEHFDEVETPMLIKSTPEGARDYLVPSRVQSGCFYALPQSPQIYKQILMLSGFDRYFQIARCFRDEDLRADRQPEFTQIDMEMSFADEVDVQRVNEGLVKAVFKKFMNVDVPTPFPCMKYSEAMNRFGSDKPDTRFGLELCDVSESVRGCGFGVFTGALENGGSVRLINAKGLASKMSRKNIDKLTDVAKTYGAKGLAFLRMSEDGESSSYEKFLSEEEIASIRKAAGAETGDVLLLVADKNSVVFAALGALRLAIANQYGLLPENQYNFLWVTDFPLFDYDEESGRYVAMHHPFTMPKDEDLATLAENPGACRAKAYDMVVNGIELGGGSIRINSPALQAQMFELMGIGDEEARQKFGFLMDAYHYGAPPHGGMAFGLDRFIALLAGCDSIRDVIAFPKVQNAGEPMSGCPDIVDATQLEELSIALTTK